MRFLECVRAEPDVWRPVLGLVHGAPAVVRHQIEETRELVVHHIEGGLSAALGPAGEDGPDVRVLAHVVLATAEEFARLTLLRPEEYPSARLVATLRRIIAR